MNTQPSQQIPLLSWGQRFALIEYYKPTALQILATFRVSKEDYESAMECLLLGQIKVDKTFDVVAQGNIFEGANTDNVLPLPVTSHHQFTEANRRPYGPKPGKVWRKRGRKTTKLADAFRSIPSTPTPALDYAEKVGISILSLSQAKRFDPIPEKGPVKLKRIAVEGAMDTVLMIWRVTK